MSEQYIAEWWAYSHKLGRSTGRRAKPKATLDEAKARLAKVKIRSWGRSVWSRDEHGIELRVYTEKDVTEDSCCEQRRKKTR